MSARVLWKPTRCCSPGPTIFGSPWKNFCSEKRAARRVEAVGDYRRRVEVIEELDFVVETSDFAALVAKVENYGGRTPLVKSTKTSAMFALSAGVSLRVDAASSKNWGLSLVRCTGSQAHLRKLAAVTGSLPALEAKGPFPTEQALYQQVWSIVHRA